MPDQTTIDTYNRSALPLAQYFAGIGPRVADIECALRLLGKTTDVRAVEIGCGDGRDAAEIMSRVSWYEGFDPSEQMIALAKEKVPSGSFLVSDALTYAYPKDVSLVFAFASLLHVPKDELEAVCNRIAPSLQTGGILYLSLKEQSQYEKKTKTDSFGERLFYYYSPQEVCALAASSFEPVFEDHQVIGHTPWFTLALRKC